MSKVCVPVADRLAASCRRYSDRLRFHTAEAPVSVSTTLNVLADPVLPAWFGQRPSLVERGGGLGGSRIVDGRGRGRSGRKQVGGSWNAAKAR